MATTPATSRLKVAVIGAGPIGLCTAAALRQQGHIVTVFERRQDPEPRGHALVIQPAATRALEYLKGAHSAFERVSVKAGPLRLWSYTGDKPFAVAAAAQQPCRSDKRFQTDRPSVQNVFHGLAVSSGVQLRFGTAVVKVEDLADSASLSTADGMTHSADLVIAADGIKSATRKMLFPARDVDPIPLRESIFLTKSRVADLAGDRQLAAWLEPGTKHGVLGPGRFILSRHMHGGYLGVQLIDVDHADPGPVNANWNTPAEVDALRARFSDFGPITRAYLKYIRHAEKWQMAMGPCLTTWRSKNGRVVLAGDAAHAMLPHGAQGLSQGIEDGISLAQMLRLVGGAGSDISADVPAVTKAWVELRKPRCDIFMRQSTENARLWSLPDGLEQRARDEKMASLGRQPPPDLDSVEMDMNAPRHSPEFLKWVRDYDVLTDSSFAEPAGNGRNAAKRVGVVGTT
ncbi:hypothetical protein MHUMG1_06561 [Metarhizium humberi]|uniref:FAD-binding domain-containing protein n=1 Tax=Metarhizium humberi TaxID=2596975 RepID=A0A9P8M894_9HYPO|nr:hypothetical protein MHUMG1_06561 [Metarhizium humberi]